MLTKINATDYNSNWQTPATGLALPLGQTLTFAPDTTFDIGAAAASRPRDLFLGRNAVIGGTLTLSADPTLALQAATKQYADLKMTQAQADARYQTPAQAAALYLPLAGGTLTGSLLFSADNTRDIGAVAATRPRTIYAATSFIGPGSVPTGGTSGQVLQKNTATSYDVGWVAPSGGITLPLGQNLTFAPDATYDIGASGANRPRDLNMSRTINAGGHGIFAGDVTAGGWLQSSTGIGVGGYTTTLTQSGSDLVVTISSSARWKFTTSGLLASADATYDIGASGANRPRTVFASGDVVVPSVITAIVGSVTATALSFRVNSNTFWNINTSGHLLANFDNASDIGAVAATRPRTIYAATSVVTPSADAVTVGPTSFNTLTLRANNVSYWLVLAASGHMVANLDNVYDLGAAGFRPRDLVLGRNATIGGTATIGALSVSGTVTVPAGSIAGTAIATGGVTTTQIADGTIATADLANAAVTNAKLAADTARANLIVNGGFEIWQRGNGPFTVNGNYTADRWIASSGASSTFSVSADSANADAASRVCAAVTYTHSAQSWFYQQAANQTDGGLVYQLRGKQVTLSLRVKTSTAGAVSLGVYGTVYGRFTGTPHNGNGTYQTLTYSITVPVNETNFQFEVTFSASCTAYIDNAVLVVGSQAADYAPLHPADDLARCQRYYEAVTAGSVQYVGLAFAYGTTTAMGMWQMLPKGSTPTVTTSPAATWGVTNAGFGVIACSGIGPTVQAGRMVSFGITVAGGLVGGNAAMMLGGSGQTATLTVEANP